MAATFDEWKEANPRHWWALEKMADGPFRQSLMDQLDASGSLSHKQMNVLWEKADQLEMLSLGQLTLPKKGAAVDLGVTITKAAEEPDREGNLTYRVRFKADNGWQGRVDLSDIDLIEEISTRSGDRAQVRGRIAWAKETYIILQGRGVKVTLG